MLVVGNEAENRTVSVRDRREGDLGAMGIAEFKEKVLAEIREKIIK